ncbi:CASC3 Barentsz domain-containing [Cordyceps militaris]|uniref:CASC3 Barentsz domain-containing n=1 Tax=Cordyceps militaris TaxID=73501 RepID=A0A2H4STA8_CORMI|nr:CASC3 Barentsz domain-containing [Cordyceps militaris]
MAPAPRRGNFLGHRRRVEDEVDGDGRPDGLDADDDSLTDGTMATDGHDAAADSDTSNIEDASPTSGPGPHASNGSAKSQFKRLSKATLHPAPAAAQAASVANPTTEGQKQSQQTQAQASNVVPSPPRSPSAPVIVSSASAMRPAGRDANARRQNENYDYIRRRDQDPAFVPNRGAFIMHDSRQIPGHPNNAFRGLGRGRGRGGRGGFASNGYGRIGPMYPPADPTTNSIWPHDMHDAISMPPRSRQSRQVSMDEGPPNGNGFIPTCKENDTPINRTLSTEKHIGNVQVRVYLPNMKEPTVYSGIQMKQYTKLPDHRPPLRRDKPVRISLPQRGPRYIYPALDRSFEFIPRALRPNQQHRVRGKPRSGFGSGSGFSRRTSNFGGSYIGSMYSPSLGLSRRSSIVHDREFMFSPTGSVISRGPHPCDRPVVRLPPASRMDMMPDIGTQFGPPMPMHMPMNMPVAAPMPMPMQEMPPPSRMDGSSMDASVATLPMHQPRPQKNISVAHIESPSMPQSGPPFQQAFHQQVPMQVGGGYQPDSHSRRPSYSQRVSGTPLSHIPERPVHAAPYSGNAYPQQGYYQGHPQPVQTTQQGGYAGGSMNGQASGYPSNAPSPMAGNYAMQGQMEQQAGQVGASSGSNNLVAQEVNGMVYYFDPSQMQPPTTYPPYPSAQTYPTSSMGMHGMMTPSPDTFYYPQTAPGMVYFPQ